MGDLPGTASPLFRLALTTGDPAGIGPDIVVAAAQQAWPIELVAIGAADVLAQRARALQLPLTLLPFAAATPPQASRAGELRLLPVDLPHTVTPGTLDVANAPHVLAMLRTAAAGCLSGTFAGMVTAPVHKGIINDAGLPFTGHTEFLAAQAAVDKVVMMLANERLRVALVTTHLPLAQVSAAITPHALERTLRILHHDLTTRFHIAAPRITVCGLNPHAGEGGHLGDEEIRIITPVLEQLRQEGMRLSGPLPADTAFTAHALDEQDAVLAMYHDQGLPVIKHQGFGNTVNVTLGLPFIRTSVDHGTALTLAGSGKADASSLRTAIQLAITMLGDAA